MKSIVEYLKFFAFIGLFLITVVAKAQYSALLEGQFKDPVPDSIGISYRKASIGSFPYTYYWVKPDGQGNFKLKISLAGPGYLSIFASGYSQAVYPFIYPGDTLFVSQVKHGNETDNVFAGSKKTVAVNKFLQFTADYGFKSGSWPEASKMDSAAFRRYICSELDKDRKYLELAGNGLPEDFKKSWYQGRYYWWMGVVIYYPDRRQSELDDNRKSNAKRYITDKEAFYATYFGKDEKNREFKIYPYGYTDFINAYVNWQYFKDDPGREYDFNARYELSGQLLTGTGLWNLRLGDLLQATKGSTGYYMRAKKSYDHFMVYCPDTMYVNALKQSVERNEALLQGKLTPGSEGDAHAAFNGPMVLCSINNRDITEASEITPSATNINKFYVVNDSGHEPDSYLVNDKGETEAIYQFSQQWGDCEATTIGSGPVKGKSYVYVGDIGDNGAWHKERYIYRFEDKKIEAPSTQKQVLQDVERFRVQYPDGARDAETLMFDPLTSDIYIVSKREQHVHVYRMNNPRDTSKVIVPELLGEIPYNWITDGSISPDGKEILLKTLDKVMYWSRKKNESILQAMQRPPVYQPYIQEQQGEAIAFKRDGRGYFTTSEGVYPDILFYPRKK